MQQDGWPDGAMVGDAADVKRGLVGWANIRFVLWSPIRSIATVKYFTYRPFLLARGQ